MRDLVRLLTIAIVGFAIIGFAMLYSRESAFRSGVTSFASGTWTALGNTVAKITGLGGEDSAEPEMAATTLRIGRPNQNSWIGLASFPDQTQVQFFVPPAGGYISGELDLHFEGQLASQGDGLMTITVNGERRAEVVLERGRNAYDVGIDLSTLDLLQDVIVVGLAARGTTNAGQVCPTESSNSGSAISLLPHSSLVLTTMSDVEDPETALIAASSPLKIYLGEDESTQARAVWAAQYMERAGVAVQLVDDAVHRDLILVTQDEEQPVSLTAEGNVVLGGRAGVNRAIAFHRSSAVAPLAPDGWPVEAARLTTETIARNFRGSKRWHLPYKLADFPEGRMPTQLDLALKASALAEGYQWVVRVSLNGNLLTTKRFDGTLEDIRLPVPLPIELQGLSNTISVELIDTTPNDSVCRVGPDAQAQLLPGTRLTHYGPQPTGGWGQMVRELARSVVGPAQQGTINAGEATRVAAMLGQFLPADAAVALSPEDVDIQLLVLSEADLREWLSTHDPALHPDTGWLVTTIGGTQMDPLGLIELGNPDIHAVLAHMKSSDMVILVRRASRP